MISGKSWPQLFRPQNAYLFLSWVIKLSLPIEKGLHNQIILVSSQTWWRWLSPVWGCRRCSCRVGFLWWVVLVIVVVCMLLVSGLIHINTSFASAATHVSNSFPDAELHSSQIFHNLFDAISRNNKNIFCQLSPFDRSSPLGGGKVFFVLTAFFHSTRQLLLMTEFSLLTQRS